MCDVLIMRFDVGELVAFSQVDPKWYPDAHLRGNGTRRSGAEQKHNKALLVGRDVSAARIA